MNGKQPKAIETIGAITDPEHVEIYSNAVSVQMSAWDINLIFGKNKIVNVDGNQKMVTNELVSVCMSPIHTKALSNALQKAVADYEREHGTLNLPQKP